jgi:hypothetical protein
MLIYVAFLLPAAAQINPATNKQITAQNYCPPCQLGKLPSSRISTDILALRAQNLQQLSASPDQKPQSTKYNSAQKIAAHSKTQPSRGSLLTGKHNRPEALCSRPNTIVQNSLLTAEYNSSPPIQTAQQFQFTASIPPPSNGATSPSSRPLFLPADSRIYFTTTPRPPSFVPSLIFYHLGISGLLALHTPPSTAYTIPVISFLFFSIS